MESKFEGVKNKKNRSQVLNKYYRRCQSPHSSTSHLEFLKYIILPYLLLFLQFENPAKGKTLKGFVRNLKESKGIDYVFVWHALSGYWGGVSTDMRYVHHSSLFAILTSFYVDTASSIGMEKKQRLNRQRPYLACCKCICYLFLYWICYF